MKTTYLNPAILRLPDDKGMPEIKIISFQQTKNALKKNLPVYLTLLVRQVKDLEIESVHPSAPARPQG